MSYSKYLELRKQNQTSVVITVDGNLDYHIYSAHESVIDNIVSRGVKGVQIAYTHHTSPTGKAYYELTFRKEDLEHNIRQFINDGIRVVLG